jgi:alpha 1,2-mannosyltransferase
MEHEQESGQMVVDKGREGTLRALHLAIYFQRNAHLYFKFFLGDKDSYRFAWRALGVQYHMVRPFLGSLGIMKGGDTFCGNSMVYQSALR